MRAHYLQHVTFEGLESIWTWLVTAGYDEITGTLMSEEATLPAVEEIDLLVVMGGPMSVNDEAEWPWLVREKALVREVIAAGKPVLGICLGAQMIASALGARVYRNAVKEIGWWPVQGVAPEGAFAFPAEAEVFHWHGETFDLPEGAVRLARSEGCENQAFQMGRTVIGLQFHLETTAESARDLVANCGDELVEGRYIQTEAEILAAEEGKYRAINALMGEVLGYLTRSQ